jgi:hypothetical protein
MGPIGFYSDPKSSYARVVASLTVFLLAACGDSGSSYPQRPLGLPVDAEYVGGVDGGEWASCFVDSSDIIHCRTYNLKTGALQRESWFKACLPLGKATPAMIDAAGLSFRKIVFRRIKPDVYHRQPKDSVETVQQEAELNQKYFVLYGVNEDCTALAQSP